MPLIQGLDALLQLDLAKAHGDGPEGRSVVAVGVFDGVHLGHQRLLHELLEMSSALQCVPTVMTFANHPDQVLHGTAPPLLVSVPHRLRLLRRAGVQRSVLLDFEPRLQNMAPEEFADRILTGSLRARGLLLGYDSALGKDRAGTPERFRELGRTRGFEVRTGSPFQVDGLAVSSTAIRAAIRKGDLALAQRYLGRFPGALGTVVHGAARGRQLGFPTANIAPQTAVLPPDGVYVVEVLLDGMAKGGVANLGARPTFGDGAPTLEVHLLDFKGDLYDRDLEVTFRHFLRPERKFDSVDSLRRQIVEDVALARAWLAG